MGNTTSTETKDEPRTSSSGAADRGFTDSTDLYEVLGVTKDATTVEIKKAFRAKALGHHPDKNAPEDYEAANERFIRIRQAYEILSDEAQREEYDRNPAAFAPQPSAPTFDHGADEDGVPGGWFSGWTSGWTSGSSWTAPEPTDQQSGWRAPRSMSNDLGILELFELIQQLETKLSSGISSEERYRLINAFYYTLSQDDERQSKRYLREYPTFGDAHSIWTRSGFTKEQLATMNISGHELCNFYGFWCNFDSSKRFEWVIKYDEREFAQYNIPRLERFIRRENKAIQTAYRKAFREIIRMYTMVLRDSDSRYDDHTARVQQKRASPAYSSELERQRQREKEKKKERKRRSKSTW